MTCLLHIVVILACLYVLVGAFRPVDGQSSLFSSIKGETITAGGVLLLLLSLIPVTMNTNSPNMMSNNTNGIMGNNMNITDSTGAATLGTVEVMGMMGVMGMGMMMTGMVMGGSDTGGVDSYGSGSERNGGDVIMVRR